MYHAVVVVQNVLGHLSYHILPFLPLPKGTPTLPLLLNCPVGGGATINIIQEIGTNYSNFGICLLNDNNGAIVGALQHEHQRNSESINRAVFRKWMQGSGRRPITWSTLATALRDASLHALADQIEGVSKRMVVGQTTNHLNNGLISLC